MIVDIKQELLAMWFYRIEVENDGLFVSDAETGDEQEKYRVPAQDFLGWSWKGC